MFTYVCASKVGFSLLHVDNFCGHVVQFLCFRVFICDNMLCTYAYLCLYIYIYIYTPTYIHIYTYVCGKQIVLLLLQFAHYLGHMVSFWRFRVHVYDNMYLIYTYLVQGNLRCLCLTTAKKIVVGGRSSRQPSSCIGWMSTQSETRSSRVPTWRFTVAECVCFWARLSDFAGNHVPTEVSEG